MLARPEPNTREHILLWLSSKDPKRGISGILHFLRLRRLCSRDHGAEGHSLGG